MRRLLSLAALLAAAANPLLANERMEHAEWASEFYQGAGEASTRENGISRFGLSCNDEICRFYYENGIDCEPGSNYPIVISTSAGSMAIETICAPATTVDGEVMRYWFAELPHFNDALMQSDAIGVAFPLSNGQFKISQFLMNGYGEATERVASGLRARRAEREAKEAAERERRTREAAERARKAQEAAERARQAAAEQAAARKAAEQEAAERARIAAEKEAAERARIAAEKEAAERARIVAEKEAAERARVAAEKEAAEQAKAREGATAQPVEPARVEEKQAEPSEAAVPAAREEAVPTMESTGESTTDAPADADAQPKSGTESTRGKRLPSRL